MATTSSVAAPVTNPGATASLPVKSLGSPVSSAISSAQNVIVQAASPRKDVKKIQVSDLSPARQARINKFLTAVEERNEAAVKEAHDSVPGLVRKSLTQYVLNEILHQEAETPIYKFLQEQLSKVPVAASAAPEAAPAATAEQSNVVAQPAGESVILVPVGSKTDDVTLTMGVNKTGDVALDIVSNKTTLVPVGSTTDDVTLTIDVNKTGGVALNITPVDQPLKQTVASVVSEKSSDQPTVSAVPADDQANAQPAAPVAGQNVKQTESSSRLGTALRVVGGLGVVAVTTYFVCEAARRFFQTQEQDAFAQPVCVEAQTANVAVDAALFFGQQVVNGVSNFANLAKTAVAASFFSSQEIQSEVVSAAGVVIAQQALPSMPNLTTTKSVLSDLAKHLLSPNEETSFQSVNGTCPNPQEHLDYTPVSVSSKTWSESASDAWKSVKNYVGSSLSSVADHVQVDLAEFATQSNAANAKLEMCDISSKEAALNSTNLGFTPVTQQAQQRLWVGSSMVVGIVLAGVAGVKKIASSDSTSEKIAPQDDSSGLSAAAPLKAADYLKAPVVFYTGRDAIVEELRNRGKLTWKDANAAFISYRDKLDKNLSDAFVATDAQVKEMVELAQKLKESATSTTTVILPLPEVDADVPVASLSKPNTPRD